MIDWYVIEFLYPVAFKHFVDKMFPNVGLVSVSTLSLYDIKKLYCFFDKDGIFLTTEMFHLNYWVYSVSLSNGIVFGYSGDSKENRYDIECEGFTECFKLMDNILRNKL